MKFERNAASGALAPDGFDAGEEPVAVAPTAHAAQQWLGDVLQREVEVGHAGGEDGIDEPVGEVARVEVEQPDPRHPGGDRLARAARSRRPPAASRLPAAATRSRPYDARSWATSTISWRAEGVDLVEDRCDGPAALRPAEAGDGAEAARPVATLGDLHVGPRCRWPVGGAGSAGRSSARGARPGPGLRPSVTGTPKPATRSTDGQRVAHLGAVALGQAPGHHEPRAGPALRVELEDGVDRLLASLVDERARVDDHEVGGGRRRRPPPCPRRGASRSASRHRPGSSGSRATRGRSAAAWPSRCYRPALAPGRADAARAKGYLPKPPKELAEVEAAEGLADLVDTRDVAVGRELVDEPGDHPGEAVLHLGGRTTGLRWPSPGWCPSRAPSRPRHRVSGAFSPLPSQLWTLSPMPLSVNLLRMPDRPPSLAPISPGSAEQPGHRAHQVGRARGPTLAAEHALDRVHQSHGGLPSSAAAGSGAVAHRTRHRPPIGPATAPRPPGAGRAPRASSARRGPSSPRSGRPRRAARAGP